MAESDSHKRAKRRAAGKTGSTECHMQDGKRLDACSPGRATEVERSGDPERLLHAAKKLRAANKKQSVLQVPNHHMSAAADAMRKANAKGSVKNMSGSRRRSINKKK